MPKSQEPWSKMNQPLNGRGCYRPGKIRNRKKKNTSCLGDTREETRKKKNREKKKKKGTVKLSRKSRRGEK